MISQRSFFGGLQYSSLLFLSCVLSLALSAVLRNSQQTALTLSSLPPKNPILQTYAERMNASRRLWELFQHRNQGSEHSSSVLLYPSTRKNNSHLGSTKWSRYRQPVQNESTTPSSRNVPHPLQLLHIDPQPGFPIRMPQFPPEHPFNPRAILAPSEMLRLLGKQNYIPEFMSYAKPMEAVIYPGGQLEPFRSPHRPDWWRTQGTGDLQNDRNQRRSNMTPDSALTMDLVKRLSTMGYDLWSTDGSNPVHQFSRHPRGTRSGQRSTPRMGRRQVRLKRRVRRALRRMLTDYTSCPVLYRWRDWGPRFWPRWIKEGQCVNLGQTSCSIPPGMFCVEAEHRQIVVLRFLCFASWPRSSCAWYRLNLPVLSRCRCGCSTRAHKTAR